MTTIAFPTRPLSQLVHCPDCDGVMLDLVPVGRHAPHYARGELVNCVGRLV